MRKFKHLLDILIILFTFYEYPIRLYLLIINKIHYSKYIKTQTARTSVEMRAVYGLILCYQVGD